MKVGRAGFLTKIVILALLIVLSITLLDMRGQIGQAEEKRAELEAKVAAQTQINADLQDAVDHSDDPDRQMDIARDELGLVVPGERVFHIAD